MPTSDPRPTERFTQRVEDYARYRPSYPPEALRAIREALGVEPPAVVADVGAGTGIFSALLLAEGFEVIAVEPNRAMREAATSALAGRPRFSIVPGSAEDTGLSDASVSFVTAAQAFHWFDGPRARAELGRVTRAPHPVAPGRARLRYGGVRGPARGRMSGGPWADDNCATHRRTCGARGRPTGAVPHRPVPPDRRASRTNAP